MSDIIEKLDESPSEIKKTNVQMAKKKAKIVDEDKTANFETRASYQAQYTGCSGIITERNTFGMDDDKRDVLRAQIKRDQKEEAKPVKGIFRNFETPGGEFVFPYRAYKGDPLTMFKLRDGKEYTIPLGVARHLRHRCEYPVRGWRVDENNLATHTATTRMVKRCTFEYTDSFDARDEEFRLKQARSMTQDVVPTHLGTIR